MADTWILAIAFLGSEKLFDENNSVVWVLLRRKVAALQGRKMWL